MNTQNPYEPPEQDSSTSNSKRSIPKAIGTVILVFGLAMLLYGAVAFWLIDRCRPMVARAGAGIVVSVMALVVQDLRLGSKKNKPAGEANKGIPTSFGVLIFLGIVIVFILVVSQM